MSRKLTKKKRAFVNKYADTGNGVQSAFAALDVTTYGSAAASASRMLKDVNVREELEILGFNENAAKKVVGEILLNEDVEPQHRLKASEQVFKVQGSYAPDKHLIAAQIVTTPNERVMKYVRELTANRRGDTSTH